MMDFIDLYGEYAYEIHKRNHQSSLRNMFDAYMKEERKERTCLDGKIEKTDS